MAKATQRSPAPLQKNIKPKTVVMLLSPFYRLEMKAELTCFCDQKALVARSRNDYGLNDRVSIQNLSSGSF